MTRAGWHTRSGSVVVGNTSAIRAHNNAVAAQLKRAEAALESSDLATARALAESLLAREPGQGRAHLIAGICAQRDARLESAEHHFRRALTAGPEDIDAIYGLAMVLCDRRNFSEALPLIEQAVARDESDARYHFRRGIVLGGLGRDEDSRKALEASIAIDPLQSLTRNALANYLRERGELVGAIEHYALAAKAEPLEPFTYGNAAVSLQELGDIHASVRLGRMCLALNPFNRVFFSNLLLALNYAHDLPRSALALAHQQYGALVRHIAPPAHTGRWVERTRLRIGVISPDLRQHPVAAFIEPLLRVARAAGLDVTCYADSFTVDDVTRRLRQHDVAWCQIASLDHDAVARRIMADELDVLLDLSGHTGSNRLTLFNERLAPLQGTWLGYTFGTGVDGMDIRLTDVVTDPPDGDDALYREKLLRLPVPFLNFDPPAIEPTTAPRKAGPVRFICLNNVAKMSEPVMRAWAQILARVPEATLTLKSRLFADAHSTQYVRTRLAACGVDVQRVSMDPTLASFEAHLRYYDAADIALDTFPYNGTTTTCEALWMGLPTVVLRGQLHAGRVGASLLTSIGLDEAYVTETEGEYVERAVALATNIGSTWASRAQVRKQMRASKLVDASDFASRLKNTLTAELRSRQSVAPDRERPSVPFCFIAGMPRSGSTWAFNVVRDMFAMSGQVVSLGFLDEADAVEVKPAHADAVHVAKLHKANPAVANILANGTGVAIVTERVLTDVLVSMARFQDLSLATVCSPGFVDPLIEARQYWRRQPNIRRVEFEAITRRPHEVIRQLRHWLGLDITNEMIDALAERWSAESVREMVRSTGSDGEPHTYFDPKTLLHPSHLVGPAEKDYRALMGPDIYAQVLAAATARENAHAHLIAFSQALSAIPVRVGHAHVDSYHADVWMQVPPDIREVATFIALEQGDWFETEIRFMRRYLEPGMRVLDVGAKHGVYALSAAQAVGERGKVIAIEPGIEPAARMLRATLVPGGAPVCVVRAALGTDNTQEYLSRGAASERRPVVESQNGTAITVRRLDSLVSEQNFDNLDYVKLDVEGNQVAVLNGGRSMLTRFDPLIQFEIRDDEAQMLDAMHVLNELGFDAYQVVPGLNVLRPFRHDADRYGVNLIAIKPSRAEVLRERGLLIEPQHAPRPAEAAHSWEEVFDAWPYARAMRSSWLASSGAAANGLSAHLEGIAWYLQAHSAEDSPTQAYGALERAAERLRLISDEQPLQRLSLATVLLELGMRERAIAVMRPLVAALPAVPDPRSEPFICPLEDYRTVQPGSDAPASDWIEAVIRATFVRISSHSALYLADQALALLEPMDGLAVMDARSRRTLILLQALNGTAGVGPAIHEWPADVMRRFENLPCQFPSVQA